jgi:hypothetical protein
MSSFEQFSPASFDSPENIRTFTEGMRTKPIIETRPLDSGSTNKVFVVTYIDGGKGIYKPKAGEEPDIRTYIPEGTYYLRECAAYEVDKLLGLGLVPPTVVRDEGVSEGVGSVQRLEKVIFYEDALEKFKEDAPGINAARDDELDASDNLIRVRSQYDALEVKKQKGLAGKDVDVQLSRLASEMDLLQKKLVDCQRIVQQIETEAEKSFEEFYNPGLKKLWLFDLIIHNTDRHSGNFFLSENGDAIAIDNGFCFNGMEFRLFKSFFGEKIPPEIAAPIIALNKKPGWEGELKEKLNGLLSPREIGNCILRINRIKDFLAKDGIIPPPNRAGKYSILSADLQYFDCYQTADYN